MSGLLTGEMILAFDDASGLALADMLLDQPQGTTNEWTEMAMSAAMETTNILCCAYLNSLSREFFQSGESSELLPSPPKFSRDFAESLLEFALMGQAIASDQVIVAQNEIRDRWDARELDFAVRPGRPIHVAFAGTVARPEMPNNEERLTGGEARTRR